MSALLQPFIDDEIDGRERESVAEHIEGCGTCRAELQSQQHVRAALRQLELSAVPEGMVERIRGELDRVDQEDNAGVASLDAARPASRFRAFARGVGMMLPAAAAAVALFFVVRASPQQDAAEAAGMLPESMAASTKGVDSTPPPTRGPEATKAPSPIARPALPEGIELVGGKADPSTGAYRYADRRNGLEFQGFVEAAGNGDPRGTRQMFRGERYFLSHDAQGRPRVQVRRGATLYTFVDLGAVQGAATPAAAGASDGEHKRVLSFAQSVSPIRD